MIKIDSSLTDISRANVLGLIRIKYPDLVDNVVLPDELHEYNEMLFHIWHILYAQFGNQTREIRRIYISSLISIDNSWTFERAIQQTPLVDRICICSYGADDISAKFGVFSLGDSKVLLCTTCIGRLDLATNVIKNHFKWLGNPDAILCNSCNVYGKKMCPRCRTRLTRSDNI